LEAKSQPKVTINAVVTRADGTVENLGVIASTENNTVEIVESEENNDGRCSNSN